jgi:hypothetical protein
MKPTIDFDFQVAVKSVKTNAEEKQTVVIIGGKIEDSGENHNGDHIAHMWKV